MGKCRWASQRVVILQIFPCFYLLIHENPRRWTHKAAAWWLRSRGEGGYLVPSLSGCAPFPEGCEGKALLVLLPSCSCCDHLSPVTLTPRAGQTVQAVCVSPAQSFIMWLGASALLYKCQSPLGQHGNGREEPPPAQHSGLDMYKLTSSSYCFRDTCLMPMMGAVSVSQSYCLCLSEDQCSF